jgi:hypothetical protein
MVDKVKPLVFESPLNGGTELDIYPTETDPTEDYLAAKGIAFENSDNLRIEAQSNRLGWQDPFSGGFKRFNDLNSENILPPFYFGTSLNETSTNSQTTFSTKITLTTSALQDATYLIAWNFNFRVSSASREFHLRIQRNSSTVFESEISYTRTQGIIPSSGFVIQENVSGAQTITLQFKALSAGTTVYCKDAYLYIKKVKS